MINRDLGTFILGGCVFAFLLLLPKASAQERPLSSSTLTGDLSEIRAKGSLRFLVYGEADHLPRSGDPKAAEQALARELAQSLGLTPVFIPVDEQGDLTAELNEGHGDVIVA